VGNCVSSSVAVRSPGHLTQQTVEPAPSGSAVAAAGGIHQSISNLLFSPDSLQLAFEAHASTGSAVITVTV
jgi:hypothetical protein